MFTDNQLEKILIKIDKTPQFTLKDELFGEKEYIDTPGAWSKEKKYYEDIFDYYRQNMSSERFDELLKWIQTHQADVRKFMRWWNEE